MSRGPPPPQAPQAVEMDDFDPQYMEGAYEEAGPQTLVDVIFNVGFGLIFRSISIAQRAPLDRINFLLQLRRELQRQKKLPARDDFDGAVSCMKSCYRKQGLRGFWRGFALRCTSLLPLIVVNNFGDSMLPSLFMVASNLGLPETPSILFANAASYCLVSAIAHPVEVIQLRLACELCTEEDEVEVAKEDRVDGVFSFVRRVLAVDGPCALWRGMGTSWATAAVGNIAFFVLGERLHAIFPSMFETPLRQGIATFSLMLAANLIIYPLDTIRRRMMMTIGCEPSLQYSGYGELLGQIRNEPEGLVGGLYAGVSFILMRNVGSFAWGFAKMKLFG